MAGAGVPAPGAHAKSKDTGTSAKDCSVEHVDDNGNTVRTSTVPEGTRAGLVYYTNGERSAASR